MDRNLDSTRVMARLQGCAEGNHRQWLHGSFLGASGSPYYGNPQIGIPDITEKKISRNDGSQSWSRRTKGGTKPSFIFGSIKHNPPRTIRPTRRSGWRVTRLKAGSTPMLTDLDILMAELVA